MWKVTGALLPDINQVLNISLDLFIGVHVASMKNCQLL